MAFELALLLAGLAGVLLGAEWLVRGASGLALSLGVAPLLVGLTVVAWGTSAPEMSVSLVAALTGSPEIAVGNAIGSNIFNVLFILGLSAAVAPLAVDRQLIRSEVPLMIGVSFLVWYFAEDERLGRAEGILLLAVFLAYSLATVYVAKRQSADNASTAEKSGLPPGRHHWAWNAALVVAGLVLLVAGSRWFVMGAAAVARWLGVSDLVIGLTIVAAGTSLPELATSVLAGLRGERDISVGNVIGSNLFNLLAVLGVASSVAENGLPVSAAVFRFDLPVMTAAAFACLPLAVTGRCIARWEGFLLLGYGVAYWLYLLLAATHHDSLPTYHLVMVVFALPLTIAGLAVSLGRHFLRTQ